VTATVAGHRTAAPPTPRVLHVSPATFGDTGTFGGGERYPYELARAMSAHGPVSFVSFGPRDEVRHDGALRVRTLAARGHWRGSEVNPLSERLLGEVARADVVHVHQWESVVANTCVVAGRALGKSVFATDHGGSGRNYWRRLHLDRLLTGFLPVSAFGAGFYPELGPRTQVIFGGVDTVRFSPGPDAVRRPRALFVGRLLPHKGIDRLIDALPSDLELLVVGRAYDADYRRHLDRCSRGRRVEFRERLDDAELIDAYRSSRAVVLPSVIDPTFGPRAPKAELFGLTLLEAMACGTPVVCTAVGGMPEVVHDGRDGFVVGPDDPTGLVDALRVLVEDEEVWPVLSAGARATALASTWDAVARRCLSLYGENGEDREVVA